MRKGTTNRFIVLEGISGSGKTELGKLLAQQIPALYYTTPPEIFRSSRKDVDEKACLESRFLFYLASVVHASCEIKKILETQSVVCDKYILSTICYHSVYGLNVEISSSIAYLQPDYTFLVICDDDTRLNRLRSSRGPIMNREKYELRQQAERQCLKEFRKHDLWEIDNSAGGPQLAVDTILLVIGR